MTIYANVVNVRSAGEHVVLEFGSFFPESGQQHPPKGHQPELRVVMSGDLLGPLLRFFASAWCRCLRVAAIARTNAPLTLSTA